MKKGNLFKFPLGDPAGARVLKSNKTYIRLYKLIIRCLWLILFYPIEFMWCSFAILWCKIAIFAPR